MPQTKYDIQIINQEVARELIKKIETVKGVKFVNVNMEDGSVVVTHSQDYDETTFKQIVGL